MNPELLRLILAQVFLHASMTGTRLAAPLLALQQGYSAAAVGVLLSLFALTQVFLALPAGRFADRRGLKPPLALAVGAAAVGTALAGMFPVFPVLCVAALLTGGATGVTVIALQRHVGRSTHSPTELKKVFSWLAIAPAAANFMGPFFAGMLIDHAGPTPGDVMGFRAAFGLSCLLPLLCWWLARNAHEPENTEPAPTGAKLRTWDLLADPMFRRLLFVNWLQSASWDVHTFVLPILGHERGLSASVIGSILGAFAVAAAGIRVLLPMLAARLAERQVIMAANVLTAVVFAAYPLMPGAFTMGICSVVLGIALGSVQPMVMSMLHQITPPARYGEALALRVMTLNASSVAMPMVFGTAGAVIGIAGVFWLVGGVVAAGTPAVSRLEAPPRDHSP